MNAYDTEQMRKVYTEATAAAHAMLVPGVKFEGAFAIAEKFGVRGSLAFDIAVTAAYHIFKGAEIRVDHNSILQGE